jgi:hypothetical protein
LFVDQSFLPEPVVVGVDDLGQVKVGQLEDVDNGEGVEGHWLARRVGHS